MKTNIYFFILALYCITKIYCDNSSYDKIQNHEFLNFGYKKLQKSDKNLEDKPKIDVLGEILKKYIESIKVFPKLDIVFLIDSSSSVGEYNFKSELKFVKKLLSDVVVDYNHTRIAVVAFSSSSNILKNIDEIGKASKNYTKCFLLTKQLRNIKYRGGETFTLGALKKAKEIFESSNRNDSKRVLFLITDGYSNGGDPIPIAQKLKENSVTIFTIGIRNGNFKELYDISSTPGEYYSYLLDSYSEFENLARRALHSDLKNGDYIPLGNNKFCDSLCEEGDCCDEKALCSCGTTTGHYSCVCNPGYYGTGLKNNCFPCVTGTYSNRPNSCLPCPDPFHTTTVPAFGINSCKCKEGYKATSNNKECKELKCHKLSEPTNGYYVKSKVCPNVIFSACGIRCEVGYTLKGNSIRLCQKNGTWSGEEPKCEVKTCDQLEIPKGGKMECFQYDTKEKFENITELPVDTICKFSCNEGHILSGSKERICLPIARWSGLKTLCKPTNCKKLMSINFGSVDPPSCQFGRQEYGKVCRFTCIEGFKLNGPSERRCSGENGVWNNKGNKTTCTDITAPNILCPEDIVANSFPGKNFGHVFWKNPLITDNSNLNISVWTKPAIKDIQTYKFEIGSTRVYYFVQDEFQNQAKCSFEIIIKDNETPTFENCIDPPTFLSTDLNGTNVTWDEPVAFDNSQNVMVSKSREFGFFQIGTTVVTYKAWDSSNNTNNCLLNITVEVSKCEPLPNPPNGQSMCANQTDGIRCLITCDDGYSIPITQTTEKANDTLFVCNNDSPMWYSDDGFSISECSETQIPNEILDGEIEILDINNCSDLQNIEMIKNDVTFFVNTEFCTENCDLITEMDCKNQVTKELQNSTISKREVKKIKTRNKVNVKYQLKRKYHHVNRTSTNSQIKLKSGYKASIQYKTKINCPQGSIQRSKRCVYCPKGSFHNITRSICQSCPFGEYNEKIGQISCIQCPISYSTGRQRSKRFQDCKEKCPPGTHARKKIQRVFKRFHNTTIEKTTLKPHCSSCGIGFYQPFFGELKCLSCPEGYITYTIASTTVKQCIPTSKELCKRNNICNNGICNIINNYEYTCNCFEHFIGTYCEQEVNLCQSHPCYNNGICSYRNNEYICSCKDGYAGKYCEDAVEIPTRTCLNNGIYYIENNGISTCICSPDYSGDLCEVKINACDEMICQNNSTCFEDEGRAYCKCSGGYIGLRCQLLPCDYKPCVESKICLNTYEENSTRDSYACVCPDGLVGENCEEKMNYCLTLPCLNGGTCYNEKANYTCVCTTLYYGMNCEKKRDTKYVFNFNTYTTSDFVKLKTFASTLTEISVCLWMQTLDDVNYGTIISYATESHDNAFTLTDYTGLVIYINNQYVVTDIHLNDGLWHHLCVTWSSFNGTYKIFLDSKLMKFGSNLAKGKQIKGNGSLILGQDQDIFGGEFSQSESFVGKLTYVDIWSKLLTEENVITHFIDCQDLYFGDLYAWPEMKDFALGGVKIEDSDFCKSCEAPKTLYNGYIDVVNNIAYYSCYTGFTLNNPNFFNGRKCTKASYWEGYYEPFCRRKYCGYPGSIRNGYNIGKNYFFDDKIHYMCYEGYNMIGNSSITCNDEGHWVPNKPRCIGIQCTAFKKPEDSNLTVMSDQSYEDYKENQTEFDIGTQIEIECLENSKLVGETILTCIENGTWDFAPPKCLTQLKPKDVGCPLDQIPKAPANGYVDLDSYYKVSNGTRNVVEYKCLDGYTPLGDNSTTCIVDGYWSEPKISCESITCGAWPKFKNMLRDKDEQLKKSYNIGDKVSFNCEEGYEKLGTSLSIKCLASRKWSRIQGKCLRKSCGKPTIADETEIEGRSYLAGDTVKLTCRSGSTYTLVCNTNGLWDGKKDKTC